ncbi:electron transfer flavoprotein subunit beta [Salinicola corii]|uniref:Electron transfer flavoprotein subunit beta n=1 Tax=Salinicola corii TaxID=2606937 RepID=A0A640WIY3_9GAMM|nr:electron transfer flavoprotein subunit beta [Salinicola corii]KAA0020588.1 electron transfer flavoprotein subunit beta [Salinicola corii]
MPQPEPQAAAGTPHDVKTAVLVSSGRHPVSGRAGRAREDARAVEMGLSLVGADLSLVHAGDPEQASLRECLEGYLGMYHGLDDDRDGQLSLLPLRAGEDALPLLAAWLERSGVRLALTGQRAECGEGSGMVGYLLAERLGWAIATGVAAIERCDAESVTVLQALPQGQRRRLEIRLPCLIAVDAVAEAPRQSAFGPARRGRIETVDDLLPADESRLDTGSADWQWQPARARPKRLKVVKSTNARDRFKAAAAKSSASGGQVLTDLSPEEAAEKLIDYLRAEKILAQDDQ